jgi:hypothetical protein
MVAGVLLSVLPHLLWWGKLGSPVWIADLDQLLYQSYATQAYFNHPLHLSDPMFATGHSSIYPWAQLGPGILIARWLGLQPMLIPLLWRIFAGASIGAAWFLLARLYVRRTWIALAIGVLLLCDTGMFSAQPILRNVRVFGRLFMGRGSVLLQQQPVIHLEWRLITPGLSLAFLLLQILLVARARSAPSRARLAAAGAAFGLTFVAYFYFWTAVSVALVLAFVLDAGHRRVYLHTAWMGALIGAPVVLQGFLLKQSKPSDWLSRCDFAIHIGHFREFLIPKTALLLTLATGFWVWRKRRDLAYVWLLALSGLLLINHQVVTGIQMENWHWDYVWGPCLTFILLVAAADLPAYIGARPQVMRYALELLLLAYFSMAVWLRAVESMQTHESVHLLTSYRHYREEERAFPERRLAANAVIAGDHDFVHLIAAAGNLRPLDHYAAVISPAISDAELDLRKALDGYLQGLDKPAFAGAQRESLASWLGWEARDIGARTARLTSRDLAYDGVAANFSSTLYRFHVRYVALKAEQAPPAYLATGWRRVEAGPYWQIWEYCNP